MKPLDKLKAGISEEKENSKKKILDEKPTLTESVDLEKVNSIVQRMKQYYKEEGIEFGEVKGSLKELRSAITSSETSQIKIQDISDLRKNSNQTVSQLGNIFLNSQNLFQPIYNFMGNIAGNLDYYLDSADMKISKKQYLAISSVVIVIATIFITLIGIVLAIITKMPLMLMIPVFVIVGLLGSTAIMMIIPKQKAQQRADALSKELPFALRHMATELKAGIGLYKTMQGIAKSDYGVLSAEFSRTIYEIEQGTDAKDALKNFEKRTQSKGMKKAISHIVRAMKTGGNLSSIMTQIAEDVSFELRMDMRSFAEKMNFFGVIFIFVAIVLPVFIAILTGIGSAPISLEGQNFIKVGPEIMALLYLVVLPAVFVMIIFYIKSAQPKV